MPNRIKIELQVKMKFSIIFLFGLVASCYSQAENIDQQWDQFKRANELKFRNSAEENVRKSLFAKKLEHIAEHNAQFRDGLVTYEIGLNPLSANTEDELRSYVRGVRLPTPEELSKIPTRSVEKAKLANVPSHVDWRERGVINRIKNQGICGSCWIFAAISNLEATYAIQKGLNVSLSEQQLVDCLKGCNGGWWGDALKWIAKNGGVNYERDYGYTGIEQQCWYNPQLPHVTVSGDIGHERLGYGDETALQEAVANVGPIVVGVQVEGDFMDYKSGIYYSANCPGRPAGVINHAVTVVGYGTENGIDYWLIRNSWGTGFGENGYMKMLRNVNLCGIADWALYATI